MLLFASGVTASGVIVEECCVAILAVVAAAALLPDEQILKLKLKK